MTRNVKRFLAVSLLSLAPSVALAEQYQDGDIDFLSNPSEYVSAREEQTFKVAELAGGDASLAPASTQNYYFGNWTPVTVSPGYSLTGTPNPNLPGPMAPVAVGTLNLAFGMISNPPVTQTYYYTTEPLTPTSATAKTCRWIFNIIANPDNTCSATINQAAFGGGGAICTFYPSLTFINPTTCQAQIATSMQ